MRLGAALMALAPVSALCGQGGDAPATARLDPGTRVLPSSPAPGQIEVSAPVLPVREIDDPHSGARWLLLRNRNHPGGPGRMVPAAGFRKEAQPDRQAEVSSFTAPAFDPQTHRPVIHAGDRLIVEQDTAVIEARMEAVALGAAAIGSSLNVRLRIGGKLLRVVALAPGRAALPPEPEVRP